jgi:hypothetical protein
MKISAEMHRHIGLFFVCVCWGGDRDEVEKKIIFLGSSWQEKKGKEKSWRRKKVLHHKVRFEFTFPLTLFWSIYWQIVCKRRVMNGAFCESYSFPCDKSVMMTLENFWSWYNRELTRFWLRCVTSCSDRLRKRKLREILGKFGRYRGNTVKLISCEKRGKVIVCFPQSSEKNLWKFMSNFPWNFYSSFSRFYSFFLN